MSLTWPICRPHKGASRSRAAPARGGRRGKLGPLKGGPTGSQLAAAGEKAAPLGRRRAGAAESERERERFEARDKL